MVFNTSLFKNLLNNSVPIIIRYLVCNCFSKSNTEVFSNEDLRLFKQVSIVAEKFIVQMNLNECLGKY